MKNLFPVIIIFGLIGCSSGILNKKYQNSSYIITNIDSINSYYLVYAKKSDSLFKIVSKKEFVKRGKKIEVGKKYILDLHSRKSEAPIIDGVKIAPVNIIDVMCYNYENDTQICTDRKKGIYDLYTTPDLIGLHYIK